MLAHYERDHRQNSARNVDISLHNIHLELSFSVGDHFNVSLYVNGLVIGDIGRAHDHRCMWYIEFLNPNIDAFVDLSAYINVPCSSRINNTNRYR